MSQRRVSKTLQGQAQYERDGLDMDRLDGFNVSGIGVGSRHLQIMINGKGGNKGFVWLTRGGLGGRKEK